MKINKTYKGDCLEVLKTLPDQSVNCCVTSPPYWGLRDYGHDGQLGLEKTPEEYVSKMVAIFKEVRRVLKDDGTLWLNLGDSYYGSGNVSEGGSEKQRSNKGANNIRRSLKPNCKPKDLVGIPWMVAFALRSDGWYLRQDIIWHKPNPMPESVTDRCTKSHEYIFLMSKRQRYYYDHEAIKEDAITKPHSFGYAKNKMDDRIKQNALQISKEDNNKVVGIDGKANKRSIWTVNTEPYSDAHFAVYPQKLIIDCIKAGCPDNGIVLDPFMGSGTTGIVARKLNRNFIGIDLSYEDVRDRRFNKELGMFQ